MGSISMTEWASTKMDLVFTECYGRPTLVKNQITIYSNLLRYSKLQVKKATDQATFLNKFNFELQEMRMLVAHRMLIIKSQVNTKPIKFFAVRIKSEKNMTNIFYTGCFILPYKHTIIVNVSKWQMLILIGECMTKKNRIFMLTVAYIYIYSYIERNSNIKSQYKYTILYMYKTLSF